MKLCFIFLSYNSLHERIRFLSHEVEEGAIDIIAVLLAARGFWLTSDMRCTVCVGCYDSVEEELYCTVSIAEICDTICHVVIAGVPEFL